MLRMAVRGHRSWHPSDDMARVFEPFDRLGAEQSGVEGTGVGLAVSKQLVERMGGKLTLDSVPGVGSTFFVDLPAASVDRADVHGEPTALPPTPSVDRGYFRVLLIEDNLTNLDLFERVLSRRPRVEVLAAMHGGLGLDLAREHMPDLVLLDLDLPDMDGMAVLDRLQADDGTSSSGRGHQRRSPRRPGAGAVEQGSGRIPHQAARRARAVGARRRRAGFARSVAELVRAVVGRTVLPAELRWPARALPSRGPGACACRACRSGPVASLR